MEMEATTNRPFTNALNKLRDSGLRPTRQRLALAKLLFEGEDRHVTAEMLHAEATSNDMHVSLATVYNTLHQFTEAGLLREVVVDSSKTYFDTNISDHHHFYYEKDGRLVDIAGNGIEIKGLPDLPEGASLKGMEIIVRLN